MEVHIKRFQQHHVLAHDRILYNTNNHTRDTGEPAPDDYAVVIEQGNTRFWIDKFHKNHYHTLDLDNDDLQWMKAAAKIGTITADFSHIFDEELAATCAKYADKLPPGNWFIRTEQVSLKYGKHGCGPYNNGIRNIIESMVSCPPGHTPFTYNDTTCRLYFMPWIDMDPNKEFRIFVYKNHITALSTQHYGTINEWLNSLTDDQITQMVCKIISYFDANIRDKLLYKESYVMDLALVGPDETPYFIEPNSFGRNYAAGSALYHWIYDHDTLHEWDTVELRYVNEY